MKTLSMRRVLPLAIALTFFHAPATSGQDVPLQMQSIDQYLMDETYEIALARSAAPDKVSGDASVLVLRRAGYVEAVAGTNGFVCLVERSWSSPIGIHRDFFNPRLRAPICYNAEAARSTLRDYLFRTEQALVGKSISEIQDALDGAIASGTIRAPIGLAMSYMLSGGQRLGTDVGRFMPHLMFYVPYATNDALGHTPGTDCYACMFEHAGGPFAAVIVAAQEFIDAPTLPGSSR